MHGTIVVADKSKIVRRMVEIALAKHPFELEFAEDGDAALSAIRSKKPALAIVDANLPGLDGYALTTQVKSDGGSTQMILLVGRNSRYDASKGRSAGVDDHLTKPFLTQKLVEKVFSAVGLETPDAAIFRTSLINIPVANKPAAAATPTAPPPGLAKPSRSKAPASLAKAPAPPPAPSAPPPPAAPPPPEAPPAPDAAAAVSKATQMVLDAKALKDALGEDGPVRAMFEQVVWEVVPQLAEAILKEEIAKVVRERMGQAQA